MLLTERKFKTFTPRQICDANKGTEVLVCLSSASRDEVDEMVRKAIAAGGTTYKEPEDHGFMYGTDSRIWMGIFGSWCSWSRARLIPREIQSR